MLIIIRTCSFLVAVLLNVYFIFNFTGNITEGMKARRMIGYAQNDIIRTTPPVAKSLVADQEELASAPAPAPAPEECSDLADLINLNGKDLLRNC